MDTRQLEYFLAVADQLSFTRAAQGLFTVQSAVSAGIRSLEAELGTALFERSTRQVSLTPAGDALVPEARQAVEAVGRMRESAAQSGSGVRGRLRVGIFASLEAIDIAALLGAFHRLYPLVELQLASSSTGSTGLADEVRAGRMDVALMGLPRTELAGLDVTALMTTHFEAVVYAGHPLAGQPDVTLKRLAEESFVDTPRGFGNRIVIDREFERRRLLRHVTSEVPDLRSVGAFVAQGLGIALLPAGVTARIPGTVVVALAGPPIPWELTIVTRLNVRTSRAADALLQLLAGSTIGVASPNPGTPDA